MDELTFKILLLHAVHAVLKVNWPMRGLVDNKAQ